MSDGQDKEVKIEGEDTEEVLIPADPKISITSLGDDDLLNHKWKIALIVGAFLVIVTGLVILLIFIFKASHEEPEPIVYKQNIIILNYDINNIEKKN